jgi:hypothetical protein
MSDVIDPAGQSAIDTPVTGQGATGPDVGQVEKPFHEYEGQSFKSPDELNQYIRSGTLRQSDYTKKTQELAEQRRAFENERFTHSQMVKGFEEKEKSYAKIKEFDEMLKRNPAMMRQMMQYVNQAPQGQDLQEVFKNMMEEQGITKKLTEFEENQKRAQAEKERDMHFETLTKKYPDFNKDKVLDMYANLMRKEAGMGEFIEALYFATKGQGVNPVELEKKVIDTLNKNKEAALPSSRGSSAPSGKKSSGSIEELRELKKSKLRGDDE